MTDPTETKLSSSSLQSAPLPAALHAKLLGAMREASEQAQAQEPRADAVEALLQRFSPAPLNASHKEKLQIALDYARSSYAPKRTWGKGMPYFRQILSLLALVCMTGCIIALIWPQEQVQHESVVAQSPASSLSLVSSPRADTLHSLAVLDASLPETEIGGTYSYFDSELNHPTGLRSLAAATPTASESWGHSSPFALEKECADQIDTFSPERAIASAPAPAPAPAPESKPALGLTSRHVVKTEVTSEVEWQEKDKPVRSYEVLYEDSFVMEQSEDLTIVIHVPTRVQVELEEELI